PTVTLVSGYSSCNGGGGQPNETDSIGNWGGLARYPYTTPGVASASQFNAINCGTGAGFAPCNPLFHMNPQYKNPAELKESQYVWIDGEILENSGIGAQEGQCLSMSVRACSGGSKCRNGQTQDVNDFAITNSICRHTVSGWYRDGRSENAELGCWGDSSGPCATAIPVSITCDGASSNIMDFTFSTAPNIINTPGPNGSCTSSGTITCTQGAASMTGTDVYVYDAGSALSSLLPNGWYQTLNINYVKPFRL